MRDFNGEPVFISIIIPVFNTYEYIERCISSIKNMENDNIEIILVDDGSTDDSGKLCDDIANKSDHIFSYHKENAGLASARNYGIEHSTGDYIIFIDSDDWVSENLIEFLCKHLYDKEIDILKFGMQRVVNGKLTSKQIPYFEEKKYNRKEIENDLLPGTIGPIRLFDYNKISIASVYCCAYRREFINNNHLRFQSDLEINEDMLFNIQCMLAAQKVEITHEILYYYDYREGSLSQRKTPNFLDMKIKLLDIEKRNLINMGYWNIYETNYFNACADHFYDCITYACKKKYNLNKQKSINEINEILNHPYCIESLKKCNHSHLTLKGYCIYWMMRLKIAYPIFTLYRLLKRTQD